MSKKNEVATESKPLSVSQVIALQVLVEQKNELEQKTARVVARMKEVMEEAGLDPNLAYDIDDNGLVVVKAG